MERVQLCHSRMFLQFRQYFSCLARVARDHRAMTASDAPCPSQRTHSAKTFRVSVQSGAQEVFQVHWQFTVT